jgi:Uncharacterized protein conserved in bacteria
MSAVKRILVDADACPVKEIIVREAKARAIPVWMVCDTSHELSDGYSTVAVVDKARDSADLYLANRMQPGDLVVSQDYGVAAMALGRGCLALNQNGRPYTAENIDQLLLERYLGQKARRAGKRSTPVKKRTTADDEAFCAALCRMLEGGGEKSR